MQGKTVVIIGGSSGMGLAVAKAALQEGAKVSIAGRSQERLAAARSSLNDDVRTFVADVSSEASVQNIFQQHDHIDHLFITTGRFAVQKIMETHPDEFRQTLEERIFGTLFAIRAAVPKMQQSGSITLTSSVSVDRPIPGITMTTLGHAATRTLARCLALELAPIRVNAIAVGWIDTPLVKNFLQDEYEAVIRDVSKAIPVNRIGKSEEVADAVIMLMKNGYISGEILNITGGQHIGDLNTEWSKI